MLHVATCCKAVVACRHPEPGPNAFPMDADGCRIVCDGEEINPKTCSHLVFGGDFDNKKDPYAPPLPPFDGTICYTKAQLATSGFIFKFLNRTKKKRTNIEGDMSLEDLEAMYEKRDGAP